MDATLFYVLTFGGIYGLMILGLKEKTHLSILLPFVAGMLGIIIMATVNADGGITVAYAQFAGGNNTTAPVWPTLYFPLFGTIISFGVALYNGFD